MRKMRNWLLFVLNVAVPLILGFLATMLAGNIKDVYAALNRPFFAPPHWVFPVAWTVLYVVMGVAMYLVLKEDGLSESRRKTLLGVYTLHLILNALWTIVFFRFGLHILALVMLIMMAAAVIYIMTQIFPESKAAFYMFMLYAAWLIYATCLNIGFIALN